MNDQSKTPRSKFWFRPILETVGPYVEGFTVCLSVFAVILILLAQFPPGGPLDLPATIAGISSVTFVQTSIWAIFAVVFALYGITHRNPIKYIRKFWLELVVCVSWIPFVDLPGISHLVALLPVTMIGTLAHFARSARWVMVRFKQHPFVVMLTAVVLLVVVAATLLMKIEPETFTSFQESVFFVYMTALTLGGKFQANTLAGEIVVMIVATCGIGVLAMVIGVVREFLQRRIFGDYDLQLQILRLSTENQALLQRLADQQSQFDERLSKVEKGK